jgi:rubredoxin
MSFWKAFFGGGSSQPNLRIRCKGCGTTYTPGVDAVSITSRELARMMPGMIGQIPSGIMIGKSDQRNSVQTKRDAADILREGPSGWICRECHMDNEWRPIRD